MSNFPSSMATFQEELGKGYLIEAYQGLMAYFRELRSAFESQFPEYQVPGNIYYGYLDMTYFSILPPSLKSRGLKIAVVFVYESFRFEVWLSGRNRQVQVETSRQIQEAGWDKYRLTPGPDKADSIVDHILVEDPDFNALASLTEALKVGTGTFIREVEDFFQQTD